MPRPSEFFASDVNLAVDDVLTISADYDDGDDDGEAQFVEAVIAKLRLHLNDALPQKSATRILKSS
jgi:hypothetical protein